MVPHLYFYYTSDSTICGDDGLNNTWMTHIFIFWSILKLRIAGEYMKEHQLKEGRLLNEQGLLNEAGYATKLVKIYDRSHIKVKGFRIKEWDYYFIGHDTMGIAVTVADNSYMWLTSVTLFDFTKPSELTKTKMGWFSNGKLGMPSRSDEGDVIFHKAHQVIEFKVIDQKRFIHVEIPHFDKDEPLVADIVLEPSMKESMVIVTPFHKPKHFYYNQKINLLKASGKINVGSKVYDMDKTYGVLDWGRGVWTYKNTWYWSSLSGEQDGHTVGFNLGYGFGDTSKASENMVFYDGKAYKFKDIRFDIPKKGIKDDFMADWRIYSSTEDINLLFEPLLDRHSHSNVLVIASNQHQVFGYFTGTIRLDDNLVIEIKRMLGFAEKVHNRW